jgi:hypothetical protein
MSQVPFEAIDVSHQEIVQTLMNIRGEIGEDAGEAITIDFFTEPEKKISPETEKFVLSLLETRFNNNMHRHKGIKWSQIIKQLNKREDRAEVICHLNQLTLEGYEPDVAGRDEETGEYLFFTFARANSHGYTENRTASFFDRKAQEDGLGKNLEESDDAPGLFRNAVDTAKSVGLELLTKEQILTLYKLERSNYSTRLSLPDKSGAVCWVKTPDALREQGLVIVAKNSYGSTTKIVPEKDVRIGTIRGVLRI